MELDVMIVPEVSAGVAASGRGVDAVQLAIPVFTIVGDLYFGDASRARNPHGFARLGEVAFALRRVSDR